MIKINGLTDEPKAKNSLDISKPFIIERPEGIRYVVFMALVDDDDYRLVCFSTQYKTSLNRMFGENIVDYVKNDTVEAYLTKMRCKIIKANIDITINCEIL